MANTKRDLVALSGIIRRKYQQLKAGQRDESLALETTFKPIVAPLEKLVAYQDAEVIKKEPSGSRVDALTPKNEVYTPTKQNNTPVMRKRKLSFDQAEVDFLQDGDVYEIADQETPETRFQAVAQTPQSAKTAQTYFNDTYGDIAGKYIFELSTNTDDRIIDKVFGLRHDKETDKFYIGSEPITIKNNDVLVNGKWYEGSKGLYELLIKGKPANYNKVDLDNYLGIVEATNAHKRNYNKLSQIAGNRSYKYTYIIKKFLLDKATPLRGEGLTLSVVNNKKTELVYWDDPNELVDRLRLLHASQAAGHNNHQNEINSIVEELREANIIH